MHPDPVTTGAPQRPAAPPGMPALEGVLPGEGTPRRTGAFALGTTGLALVGAIVVLEAIAEGAPALETFRGTLFVLQAGLYAWWMWGSRVQPRQIAAWGGAVAAAAVLAGAGAGTLAALEGALDPAFLVVLGLWWADEPRRWLWGAGTLAMIALALASA